MSEETDTPDVPPVVDDPGNEPTEQPTGIYGDDGFSFRENWYEEYQADGFDEIRSTAAQFKDPVEAIRAFKETRSQLTKIQQEKGVKVPTAESTPEEIAAYREAIGVPESADGYKFDGLDNLPEGVSISDSDLTSFREFAHKEGISEDLAKKLIQFQASAASAEMAEYQQHMEDQAKAAQDALRTDWGNKFEANSQMAKRAAKTFGLAEDSPLLSNPDVLRAMARAGSMISEDKLVTPEEMGGSLSPGSEANDILKNPENPLHAAYWDSSHPQHQHAVDTYRRKLREQVKREGY